MQIMEEVRKKERAGKSSIRREQILEKSARLFRKSGYTATSMRMIAAACNMEAGSLYNHLRSKQDLLDELLFSVAAEFTSGMAAAEKRKDGPYEKIEFLVDLHIDLTLRWPDRIALVTGEWIHLEEPRLKEYLRLRNDYENRFLKLLQEGMESGIFRVMDTGLSLYSILSSLHWLYSWTSRHPEIDTATIRSELKTSLLSGLKNTR
jgi:AcrR family transcriptional regulator